MKRNMQRGFTLIELMIVIAIVAILVALAVPAYQDYAIRSKVTECIGQAASSKLAVEEYYQTVGVMPATSTVAGLDNWAATQYCTTMDYSYTDASHSYITLTTTNTGANTDPVATLTPEVNATANKIVRWDCEKTSTGKNRHMPASCRSTT